jgi:hypothetical protein
LSEVKTNSSKVNIVVSFEDDQKVLKCLAEQKYFSSVSSENIMTVHCKQISRKYVGNMKNFYFFIVGPRLEENLVESVELEEGRKGELIRTVLARPQPIVRSQKDSPFQHVIQDVSIEYFVFVSLRKEGESVWLLGQ